MHRTMLGEDFARSMNVPLADLVYLQAQPASPPHRRGRRLHRLLRARTAGSHSAKGGTTPRSR